MLRVKNISKSFGKRQALKDVSIELDHGECLGLVGPNGAGKTTLLNLISGFLSPDSGTITLDGEKITPSAYVSKKKIGVVPQEIALYENLSVLDNLLYFGELYGLGRSHLLFRINELLEWIQLLERKKEKVKFLSGGMKRRINLAAGLLHSPKLLLVDEPTVGVDPQARLFIYNLIKSLRENGTTLLYTTHYLPEVEHLCNQTAILNEGKLAAFGTTEKLLNKTRTTLPAITALESVYFGLTGKELRE